MNQPPDEIWDCVASIWFGGHVARPHAKRVGRIVRDLKDLGATVADIQTRLARYKAEWPNAEPTPEAVVKHWCRFAKPPKWSYESIKDAEAKMKEFQTEQLKQDNDRKSGGTSHA